MSEDVELNYKQLVLEEVNLMLAAVETKKASSHTDTEKSAFELVEATLRTIHTKISNLPFDEKEARQLVETQLRKKVVDGN